MQQTLDTVLAEQPFLGNLSTEQLQYIGGCAFDVKFDAKQFIFREGEAANHFYVVTSGKVALEVYVPGRGPITVETIGPGEILGWSWLFPPYRWHFDGRAVEGTKAIAFDAKCLRLKCEEDHDLGYELVKQFAHVIMERLQATRIRMLDVYGTQG